MLNVRAAARSRVLRRYGRDLSMGREKEKRRRRERKFSLSAFLLFSIAI
jgi:hypothetical protein